MTDDEQMEQETMMKQFMILMMRPLENPDSTVMP